MEERGRVEQIEECARNKNEIILSAFREQKFPARNQQSGTAVCHGVLRVNYSCSTLGRNLLQPTLTPMSHPFCALPPSFTPLPRGDLTGEALR